MVEKSKFGRVIASIALGAVGLAIAVLWFLGSAAFTENTAQAEGPYFKATNLEAAVVMEPQMKIELTWDAPVGFAGEVVDARYEIWRWKNGFNEYAKEHTGNSYTDTASLERGAVYQYDVRAFTRQRFPITTYLRGVVADYTRPGKVVNLSATATGPREVTLSWEPPADDGRGALRYHIDRATRGGEGRIRFTFSRWTEGTSFTDTSVSPNTKYTYRVRAANASVPYGKREKATLKTPAAVPGEVTAVRLTPDGANEILVSWDAPEDDGGSAITHYVVRRSAEGESLVRNKVKSGTSFNDTGLEPDTEYTYKIRAFNKAGNSTSGAFRAATGPDDSLANDSSTLLSD